MAQAMVGTRAAKAMTKVMCEMSTLWQWQNERYGNVRVVMVIA